MATFESESDLLEMTELMTLLGIKDSRTIRKWCKTNSLALVKLGKRTYVSRSAIETLISARLSSPGLFNTVQLKLSKPTGESKKEHSKAALEYIRKFKES